MLAALGPAVAAAGELMVLEEGRAVAPFTLMLGDEGNWAQAVAGIPEAVSSSSGALRIEAEESGGLRATWNNVGGESPAQIYLQAGGPMDVSELAAADAALVLLLKVNRTPGDDVELRMGCGYPCQAEADVTRLFQAVPVDTWGTVSFALSCFVGDGLRPERVDAPFVLATAGAFSISLRQIAILEGLGSEATVQCR
ncbi:putative glycoside hydrolase [Lentisalinibacter salinarum]|uniref:putative glycoside hydrolase n=1 Tax=Lentisalinibacter salinarum TaxID=2992239 RepID=UPI00386BCF8C